MDSREAYIKRIHGSYGSGFEKNGVTLIKGFATFVDRNTIEVNGKQYSAEHILIATGGRPTLPNIPGCRTGHRF